MKALDSSILIRYLVEDDPQQARQASRIVEEAQQNGERLFLSLPVICETVWVLHRRYRHTRSAIADGIGKLLGTPVFLVERAALVESCLLQYRTGKAGIVGYLIGAIAVAAGCDATITFDRDLRGSPGFRVL